MKDTQSGAGAGSDCGNESGDDCDIVFGLANVKTGKAADSSDSSYEQDRADPPQVPIKP